MIATNAPATTGLCSTCNNAPTCFHHARRGPALFCELFDNYVLPDAIIADRASSTKQQPFSVRAADEKTIQQAGLCGNCDHSSTCSHSKQEGGIWHCEDYQ